MGRFVGEIGQKTAKTTTIFKSISPTLDFFEKTKILAWLEPQTPEA